MLHDLHKAFLFYVRINCQFKTRALKSLEKLVEQSPVRMDWECAFLDNL